MTESQNTFSTKPFPRIQKATIGVLQAARKKNMIHTLLEVDISKARKQIRKLRRETQKYYSLTGYIIYCVARAVEQYKHIHDRASVSTMILWTAPRQRGLSGT